MSAGDYAQLAALRAGLRSYLAWAEDEARRHDTTPMQFQLALAIRSCDEPGGPTISAIAETLQLKHHSAVGLVDRAEASGVVRRQRDVDHAARVRVALTPHGTELLEELAISHRERLQQIGGEMAATWQAFVIADATSASTPTPLSTESAP